MHTQQFQPPGRRRARGKVQPWKRGNALRAALLALGLSALAGCSGDGDDGAAFHPVAPPGPGPAELDRRGDEPSPPDGSNPPPESPLVLSFAPLDTGDPPWPDGLLLDDTNGGRQPAPAATPEPLTGALAGTGAAALTGYLGRRRR